MEVLAWVLFGLLVGALAKLLLPGKDPGGCVTTSLIGVAGALLGGFLGRALGIYGPGQTAGLVMSVVGAVLLLLLWRFAVGRRMRGA
ncbi:GlsB/YeaQ/YmgE family stress response membrane protein [Myxococcota bacterium]|nr:GlsB/YeaQ/YmgE family stress response membrane protein [Myxococcota bacterium]